jgi:hypothetical protein
MWYLLKETDGKIHVWERSHLAEFSEALKRHNEMRSSPLGP